MGFKGYSRKFFSNDIQLLYIIIYNYRSCPVYSSSEIIPGGTDYVVHSLGTKTSASNINCLVSLALFDTYRLIVSIMSADGLAQSGAGPSVDT